MEQPWYLVYEASKLRMESHTGILEVFDQEIMIDIMDFRNGPKVILHVQKDFVSSCL